MRLSDFKCAGDSARYSNRASFLPLLSGWCCAGGLGPVRKLNKISQDIKRLVALRID